MCECREAATCTTEKKTLPSLSSPGPRSSQKLFLFPATWYSHRSSKSYSISEPKPRASAKRTARLCYIQPDLKGLGKKGNESLYQFSRSREIPGPSPGQTQMYSGGCSCQPQTKQRRPPGSPNPSCCAWGNMAPAAPPGHRAAAEPPSARAALFEPSAVLPGHTAPRPPKPPPSPPAREFSNQSR